MGSWQQREADVALDLQSKSPDFPVIPVLLPGSEPPLGFLGQLMWVDFRSQLLDQAIAICPYRRMACSSQPQGRPGTNAVIVIGNELAVLLYETVT